MKLKKNELANTGLICGSLEICLEKGFNCTDCPHIPNNKRIYDPYTGERDKREKEEDMSAEEYQRTRALILSFYPLANI